MMGKSLLSYTVNHSAFSPGVDQIKAIGECTLHPSCFHARLRSLQCWNFGLFLVIRYLIQSILLNKILFLSYVSSKVLCRNPIFNSSAPCSDTTLKMTKVSLKNNHWTHSIQHYPFSNVYGVRSVMSEHWQDSISYDRCPNIQANYVTSVYLGVIKMIYSPL